MGDTDPTDGAGPTGPALSFTLKGRFMKVVVYGRPDNVCQACRGTKRGMKRHGVEYEFRNVDTDPEAEAYVKALGALEVPVVVWKVDEETGGFWTGYRPDDIRRLAAITDVG